MSKHLLRTVILAFLLASGVTLHAGGFVLNGFTATANGRQVDLAWTTASEITTDYFIVEKTTDGVSFTEVAHIHGTGTTSMPVDYTASDLTPSEGTSYYRLKQFDVNGAVSLSGYVTVTFERGDAPSLMAFPNPGNGSDLNIRVDAEEGEELTVTVRGVMGKEYFRQIVRAQATGENVFTLTPDHQLESGTYMVVITSGETVQALNWMVR